MEAAEIVVTDEIIHGVEQIRNPNIEIRNKRSRISKLEQSKTNNQTGKIQKMKSGIWSLDISTAESGMIKKKKILNGPFGV